MWHHIVIANLFSCVGNEDGLETVAAHPSCETLETQVFRYPVHNINLFAYAVFNSQ